MLSNVSFFDLDRTLTRRPTWLAFLVFCAGRRQRWRLALLPVVAIAMILHVVRVISRDRLKEIMHRLLLGSVIGGAELERLADRFADRLVLKNLREGALDRIAADRALGCRVVVATAAHRFCAEPIARRIGIDDVIATECTFSPCGMVGWRLRGRNLYGPAKLAAVESWLSDRKLARDEVRLRFYSDHVSDAPCLAFADEPYAVHPEARLKLLAKRLNWPTLHWDCFGDVNICVRSS